MLLCSVLYINIMWVFVRLKGNIKLEIKATFYNQWKSPENKRKIHKNMDIPSVQEVAANIIRTANSSLTVFH